MFIEFSLKGTNGYNDGVFDTTGFWVKFEEERCDITKEIQGYKIYSHFSFSYYNENLLVCEIVYRSLLRVLAGFGEERIKDVGFIREIS